MPQGIAKGWDSMAAEADLPQDRRKVTKAFVALKLEATDLQVQEPTSVQEECNDGKFLKNGAPH